MWTQIVSALLGVWLMFAPAALGHAGSTLADFDRTAGPFIASISFLAATRICRSLRWTNLATALVLLLAPWFLGAPVASTVNTVVTALVVLVLTPFGRPDPRRFGNGWSTLIPARELPGWDAPRGESTA